MASYTVDTAVVRRLATRVTPLAQTLRAAASQVEAIAGAATATGSGACAGALTAFCNQWAEELRQEAEAYENIATAMVASSVLYEAVEVANLAVGEMF